MGTSEHIAQALFHLEQAANQNHDHLLLEARHSEWTQRVLESALASAASSLIRNKDEVSSQNEAVAT